MQRGHVSLLPPCIAKPQRVPKCVQCSRTTCIQGTRVICIGVRCSRWRALSARSSGRLIRNPVLIPLQMCFLLRQLHGLLFIAFQVLIVHQRPLCIQTLTTKLQTQKRPCTQLHRRIPRRRVMQPGFFCSFLLQCNVPPTCLCIAAVSDSHSHQLLGHLHPNTSVPALYAHFLQLLQSAQSVPSSRFLPQTLLRVRPFLLIFSAVHCATHVPVLQCLPAIVINS